MYDRLFKTMEEMFKDIETILEVVVRRQEEIIERLDVLEKRDDRENK